MKKEKEQGNEWYRRGKTYRAKSLDALKALYASGIHATLEGCDDIDSVRKPHYGEISEDGGDKEGE